MGLLCLDNLLGLPFARLVFYHHELSYTSILSSFCENVYCLCHNKAKQYIKHVVCWRSLCIVCLWEKTQWILCGSEPTRWEQNRRTFLQRKSIIIKSCAPRDDVMLSLSNLPTTLWCFSYPTHPTKKQYYVRKWSRISHLGGRIFWECKLVGWWMGWTFVFHNDSLTTIHVSSSLSIPQVIFSCWCIVSNGAFVELAFFFCLA